LILLVDNYDSFTFNLAQTLGEMGRDIRVLRNDSPALRQASRLRPEAIVISPGPGRPESAGLSNDLIRRFTGRVPILGVCLGHQCIARFAGARVEHARRLMHGKTSRVYHDGTGLYQGLSNPFIAGRYHSLIVRGDPMPDRLEVTAFTSEGEVMGVRVRGTQTEGLQFHPESILTPEGGRLLKNFAETLR
jgi:anthranilate synthase/aminodeoxychorismate synthase-like glutamine amidotransferase